MFGQKVDTPISGAFRGLFTLRGFLKYGLLAIGLVAVAAVIYYNTQMKPHDFLSMYEATAAPAGGQVTRYPFQEDPETLDLTEDQAVALWEEMGESRVRFMQTFSAAQVPSGGYYYEVSLADGAGETAYAFGTNTAGELIIQGKTYAYVGESGVLDGLDALFHE